MHVSNRLKSIAGLVIDTDHVADIGCDHALLDIYLVKEEINNHIIVSDINQSALDNAIANIHKYHLSKNITPKLGNGLDVIEEDTDTLIISGMGSNTIIKILSNHK